MIKDEVYKFFADYIYKQTGMVYAPADYYRLDSRINDLVKLLEVKTVEEVYEMYKRNITPDMRAILINISTNNETYFFRDVKPFTVLLKEVYPEIIKANPTGSINLWSAASSTGQEICSIIMTLKNGKEEEFFNRSQFFASDVSTNALNKAKSGLYNGLDVQRGLPINLLMKYFTQLEGDSWQFDKSLGSKINYFEFNLLTGNFPTEQYHIVFCRNVLIYQNKENKTAVLLNIYKSLKKGGIVFMGSGESLIGIDTPFERVTFDGLTVYRKN